MSIWASKWTGTGTEQDPYRPEAVLDPTKPWRSAAFPECVFTNTFGVSALEDPDASAAGGPKPVLVAPNIDTPVTAMAASQVQSRFGFTIIPGETLRQAAARRGVYFQAAGL